MISAPPDAFVPEEKASPLLRIEEATVVKSGKTILDGLSLTVAEGEHTAILGPNGSGKSSLIKLLTQQYYPLARSGGLPVVTIFGRDRWNVSELRALIGIVSSDLHQAFSAGGEVRGLEAVLSGFFASQGLGRHHAVTEAMYRQARAMLVQVEAAHLAERPLTELSTGEVRRLLIARALVTEPRALVLDEPTAGLDMAAARRFLKTVRHLSRLSRTIVLVTHHVEEIVPEINRIVLMKDGKIFRDGSKREVLTDAHLSALFGASVQVRESGGYFRAEVRESCA